MFGKEGEEEGLGVYYCSPASCIVNPFLFINLAASIFHAAHCSAVVGRNATAQFVAYNHHLCNPCAAIQKKYILFTYTNNYSPQLGDSNFGFPASNRFFTGQ